MKVFVLFGQVSVVVLNLPALKTAGKLSRLLLF